MTDTHTATGNAAPLSPADQPGSAPASPSSDVQHHLACRVPELGHGA